MIHTEPRARSNEDLFEKAKAVAARHAVNVHDLSALETVGVKSLRDAVRARQLVVIDEIGPMEIRSASFRDAVNEVLESDVALLATIFARSLPFTDAIKSRPDVTLVEVRADNREKLVSELPNTFRNPSPGEI